MAKFIQVTFAPTQPVAPFKPLPARAALVDLDDIAHIETSVDDPLGGRSIIVTRSGRTYRIEEVIDDLLPSLCNAGALAE